MKSLVDTLKLSANPFEHYTAETEPNITDYAVRPPYLQAISDRARSLKTFILFGDRGAGKSATRITVYNEIWGIGAERHKNGAKLPFVVNMTDYSAVLPAFTNNNLTDIDLVGIAAFAIVEQVLVWLSSLEEEERQVFVEGLDETERTLIVALLQGFYLSVPPMDREISTADALRLLNSAWTTKSTIWISRRWDALSKIVANLIGVLSRKEIDSSLDISAPVEALLKSLTGGSPNAPRAILVKLAEFVKCFGYSGVVVLVDKVDETPQTSNSAEATARLIYPLLSHTHLLEVPDFSWIIFLWSNVQNHFEDKYHARLDKLAHARITWNRQSLKEMVDVRISFFSRGKKTFSDLFQSGIDADNVFSELVAISVSSPRELIKLMDTIFREHDARGSSAPDLLDSVSVDVGQDKYALHNIGSWFPAKPLQQVLRLGKIAFVNRDVQMVFKISDQGARVKIKNWEDAGLVQQSGTAPSELGGKPAYRFVVADTRIERIISRKLDEVVGAELEEPETGVEA